MHFICWMSAIFLLPVCLTYWPRKYTIRVDPHVDNSHQVWSWYDHPLPSYSVFVCWYVTWPCEWPWLSSVTNAKALDCVNFLCVTLWPFDLEQLSFMANHVTNLATKYEAPTPIRSWVTSYNGSHWLALEIGARVSAVAFLKNPQKIAESLCAEGREITHAQTETPKPMWIKFCTMVDITDVVTHTNFPLSHWLSSSSLQHCRTTVRACDVRTFLYEKCDVGRIINHSVYRRRSCCNKDYSARRRLVGAW